MEVSMKDAENEDVGETTQYYLDAFEKLDKNGKHTWNWAAFFMLGIWFGYRKMYLESVVLYVINLILDEIADYFIAMYSENGWFVFFILIAITTPIHAIAAYYGNSMYYRKVKNMIGRGAHEINENRPTSLVCALVVFSVPFFWFSDYMTLKNHKAQSVDFSRENIVKYIDVPNSRKKHLYDKIATFLGITLPFMLIVFILFAYSKSKYSVDQQAISTKMEKIKEDLDRTNE